MSFCTHAGEAVLAGRVLSTTSMKTGNFLIPTIRVCDECRVTWPADNDEDAIEAFLESMLVPVCAGCARDAGV
jgi:hypothetical protein